MQILIRTIRCSANSDVKSYLRKKILKHELLIPKSSVIECTFEKKGGPKRDGNLIVHMAMRFPGTKKRIFAKSKASPDFNTAIDTAEAKFSRMIRKQNEMRKFDGKRSKYLWSRVKQAPGKALGRLSRKSNE